MNLTIITTPATEPFTLSQVYAHCNLDASGSPESHEDDDILESMISRARSLCEVATNRSIGSQTLRLSMAGFPVSAEAYLMRNRMEAEPVRNIRLLRPPFISVSNVKYYDVDNTLQTLSASNYYTTDEQVPQLRFVSLFTAPTVYDRPDAVRVEYVAGYTTVPEPLRQWMLLQIGAMYENREAFSQGVAINELPNRWVSGLLDGYVIRVLA